MALAGFQQLTGINVVMFYSSKIFQSHGDEPASGAMSVVIINFWVYFVNFVAVIGAILLLSRFGRRTLMIVFNTG